MRNLKFIIFVSIALLGHLLSLEHCAIASERLEWLRGIDTGSMIWQRLDHGPVNDELTTRFLGPGRIAQANQKQAGNGPTTGEAAGNRRARSFWWLVLLSGVSFIASLVAVFVYGDDKRRAQAGSWRYSENTLHWIGVLGGWPGALWAQKKFRHKTQKLSFQIKFWGTVVLHVGLCIWLILLDARLPDFISFWGR